MSASKALAITVVCAVGACSDDDIRAVAGGAPAVACPPGFADCDDDPGNGCEGALETSVDQCGACGRTCIAGPNAIAVCSAGDCADVCELGFGDCDGDPANGCERDLRTDLEHCGACSHGCTSACDSGACDLEVLADGQVGASFLLDEGDALVWVSRGSEEPGEADGAIRRIAKAGGAITTIAANQRRPTGIAALGEEVVWASYGDGGVANGAILRAPKTGAGPIVVVVEGIRTPVNVVLDEGWVYWSSFGSGPRSSDGGVFRRSLDAAEAPVEELAGGESLPFGLAVDETHLYWTSFGLGESTSSVKRLPKRAAVGTRPEAVVTRVAGASHPWSDGSGVLFGYHGVIARIDPASGEARPVLRGAMRPFRLWRTGEELHWTTLAPGGPIESSTPAGPVVSRGTGPHFPYDLVVDDKHIYWTSIATERGGPGALLRMAR